MPSRSPGSTPNVPRVWWEDFGGCVAAPVTETYGTSLVCCFGCCSGLGRGTEPVEIVRVRNERRPPNSSRLICPGPESRKIISIELENLAEESGCSWWSEAPWKNSLCERTGGILKTTLTACTAARLMDRKEMALGLGEGSR